MSSAYRYRCRCGRMLLVTPDDVGEEKKCSCGAGVHVTQQLLDHLQATASPDRATRSEPARLPKPPRSPRLRLVSWVARWSRRLLAPFRRPPSPDAATTVVPPDFRPSDAETVPTPPSAGAQRSSSRSSAARVVRAGPAEPQPTGPRWKVGDVILDLYEVLPVTEGLEPSDGLKAYHEGGMGRVYRVRHRNWNMDLALKCPLAELFRDPRLRQVFSNECESWIQVGLHPHVASCFYVRELEGVPCIFAEYVAGDSLQQCIERGRLYAGSETDALARLLDVGIQVAWGLHFAHEKGVVHQDVKPHNVMLTRDGVAKVVDFGLARARAAVGLSRSTGSAPLTRTTDSLLLTQATGYTPLYCSPEQLHGRPLTRRTDIWSWAVTVLQMFVGEVAWDLGTAAPDALRRLLDGRLSARLRLPVGVAELLQRCLQPDQAARPRTLLECAEALKAVYRQELGQCYRRRMPEPAALLAPGWNNRGVSYLELGRSEQAEAAFREALRHEPHHPEATYNFALLEWHSGRVDDHHVLRRLTQAAATHADDARLARLTAWVHCERGDAEAAAEALKRAERAGGSPLPAGTRNILERLQQSPPRCVRTLSGHTGPVQSVAVSADGRLVLSCSDDGTVRLWRLESQPDALVLCSDAAAVGSVALDADGRLAVVGGADGRVRLWELAPSSVRRGATLEGHSAAVRSVVVTADRRWALSADDEGTLRLWDLSTGRCAGAWTEHQASVPALAVSRDGRLALSGSWDGTVRLWDLAAGRCLRVLEGHTDWVRSVALCPDGRVGLSAGDDRTVRVWDLATGVCRRTLQGHRDSVTGVAVCAHGRLAVSGSVTGGSLAEEKVPVDHEELRVWDLATGQCVRTLEGDPGIVLCLALDASGRTAVFGSSNGTLKVWDLSWFVGRRWRAPLEVARVSAAAAAEQSDAEYAELLREAGSEQTRHDVPRRLQLVRRARSLPGREFLPEGLRAWRDVSRFCRRSTLRTGWLVRTVQTGQDWLSGAALSGDGQLALSAGYKTLKLWDLAAGRCLQTVATGHGGRVRCVAVSPDGRRAATGSEDGTVRLWELPDGRLERVLEGHQGGVRAVAFAPDGRLVLSASDDHTLRLWCVQTGQCQRTLAGHTCSVLTAAFGPDGRWAVSGSSEPLGWHGEAHDIPLRRWDLASSRCVTHFEARDANLRCVAVTPDGQRVVSGGDDSTLKLWKATTGQWLQTLEGHEGSVLCAAVSPDGRFALSGSEDRTLKVWDLTTGRCLRTFADHNAPVVFVAFTHDGHSALSASEDGTLKQWELDWELEFPGWSDWDEGVRPYLETFLTLQTPLAPDGVTRQGRPTWNEDDFERLLRELQARGFGWVRPEGVRERLAALARAELDNAGRGE